MPVSEIHKTVSFTDFSIKVEALKYECNECGFVENFPSDPMPQGKKFAAYDTGWRGNHRDFVACPQCEFRKSAGDVTRKRAAPIAAGDFSPPLFWLLILPAAIVGLLWTFDFL